MISVEQINNINVKVLLQPYDVVVGSMKNLETTYSEIDGRAEGWRWYFDDLRVREDFIQLC